MERVVRIVGLFTPHPMKDGEMQERVELHTPGISMQADQTLSMAGVPLSSRLRSPLVS